MPKHQYTVTTPEKLRTLCIRNNWFTAGTNEQYEKLFYANEMGCPIEEITTIIWVCTDCENQLNDNGVHWCRRDIQATLEEAQMRYHEECAKGAK